jgi:hypothetical protein
MIVRPQPVAVLGYCADRGREQRGQRKMIRALDHMPGDPMTERRARACLHASAVFRFLLSNGVSKAKHTYSGPGCGAGDSCRRRAMDRRCTPGIRIGHRRPTDLGY